MSELQLTPLGTSPAWYNAGQACSGFLLEAAGARVLVDCGSGVISRYLELFGPERPIDAIVLGHLHPDHSFDLVPLKYGIQYGELSRWRPQLWLPPGAEPRLTRLASAWDDDFSFFTETFDVRHYGVDDTFDIGPFECAALEVPHYIESFALRLEHRGISFGYTSDLGPTSEIAPFMKGVDLLLSEAGVSERADLNMPGRGHITATEAGRIAASARVRSLLLTHVPAELDPEHSREAAARQFAGPVAIAASGETYVVGRHLAAVS